MKKYFQSVGIVSVVAALCVSLAIMPLMGCPTQATWASLTQTLGSAAGQVAQLEGNTALAAQLSTDTTAAVTAVTNWKNGTPAQDVIQALSIVEDDLNLIPGASQYAPLINIAIATVQTLLAMLPVPTVTTTPTAHKTRNVSLGHKAPTSSKDFKKQWNAVIQSNPTLSAATIK